MFPLRWLQFTAPHQTVMFEETRPVTWNDVGERVGTGEDNEGSETKQGSEKK